VAAGISFAVDLILDDAGDFDPESYILRQSEPAAILIPTTATVVPTSISKLRQHQHLPLVLSELVGAGDHHDLALMRPLDEVLRPLRERLLTQPIAASRAWVLPPDAQWRELRFEVVSKDVINVRFRGQTRRFEPEQLGMKSKKTGKPTLDWVALRTLALREGTLSWSGSNPKARATVVKRKQLLAGVLIREFGIQSDPLPWDERARVYVAQFRIVASNPTVLR